MRMPRFAKLQNALIRKQSDKKKSGALAFINSPLGLWILSKPKKKKIKVIAAAPS
jgi:hypothetical protein